MLARACAEVAARAPFAARTGPVFVVVNGVDVGPVPSGVWERVQERIVSILDEHVTIQEEPHAPAHAEAAADPMRSGSRKRAPRALVAVHVASVRTELLACFAREGFDVVGVADGAQARRQLEVRASDVIVADFELPRLAGDELLAEARAKHGAAVRVGVLLGVGLPQILVPEHEAADLVIGQPLTPRGVVERVLGRMGKREREIG